MQQHGFTLAEEHIVKELDSTARLWKHNATGAEVLSFLNKDENKVFGVSFRTPPADSTGVAHILEHSVLCGSEKYPVKEPFVELLKGSLQTFLNAFTYPDKTCYPVASANLQDFRNLTDVYLDAVFFPRITKAIFQQEGWHLEPVAEAPGDLIFKGVVYNEMKGAFSAPESVLGRYCLHALFPDTVYALESGGDPKAIPDLTYEAFCDFHRRYYHPGNGRFFFWGDDDEAGRLERLGAVLARFTPLAADSAISVQKPLKEPAAMSVSYAASEEENKGMVVVNWVGPDVMDVELGLAFRMLEHILLGMPASPLRRALIESGLGEDLAGQGLETELRQLIFDAGLKGVEVENTAKVEPLVLDTLRRIVAEGLAPEMVEAAVNSVEFALRENNSGRFPVGLSIMLRSLCTWLHNGDPLAPLRFEAPLAAIKKAVAQGSGYFESLISRWLIDNTHRVTVTLLPDPELGERMEVEERERLAALTARMSPAERKQAEKDAAALHDWQETPDSPEALASIPRLSTADLPRENAQIATAALAPAKPPVLFHPQPTAGIVYAEAAFTLQGVPEPLLPLLPLLGRALLEMGTRKRDFVDLNMTIARKTGGMDAGPFFLTHTESRAPVAHMSLSGKAAPDKAEELFALMEEVLNESRLDQQERFLRMTLEEKARLEHSFVPSGHMVVVSRLRAGFSDAGLAAERTGGVGYFQYLRELAERVEKQWPGVLADLETLLRCIVRRNGLMLNLTATAEQGPQLERLAAQFVQALPDHDVPAAAFPSAASAAFPHAEALLLPAQVNYVGKGINLYDTGYSRHGSASVILKYLRTGYLWDRVRVQGGAYGCMCGLDRMSGTFYTVSYRDPNILPTLDIYNSIAGALASGSISRAELDAAVVGAIGELDTYLLPDAKGSAAFTRLLTGDTEELRAQLREEILGTEPKHFKEFGQALEAFTRQGRICALGGAALERTAKEQDWQIVNVL